MPAFAALPPTVQLALVGLAGCFLGAAVNWATYRLAWFKPREISPWGPTPKEAPPRKLSDRIPIVGWLALRREQQIHGRGFWVRPMLIELAMGIGLAMLFRWEVHQEQLIIPLVEDWLRVPGLVLANVVPVSWTHATFANHALLITLMAAASFIDIDEKIIPDEITIPGTLLGLFLATLLPMGILAHVELRAAPEPVSQPVALPAVVDGVFKQDVTMYVEPATLAAPNAWPGATSSWAYLAIGQACWWLWCFALTPRIFRGRRGLVYGLTIVMRRVVRELMRPPLAIIALVGSMSIVAVWWLGGGAWVGLLTSLVGLAVSGGLIWAVRIIGTAALGREAMGFGDVTLMMMVGTFLGWQAGVIIFFVAPFAGLVVGVVQLITRRDDEIPYGPFLCLGALFVIVRWPSIWNNLQGLFQAELRFIPPGMNAPVAIPNGWVVPVMLSACILLLGVMLFVWQRIKDLIR